MGDVISSIDLPEPMGEDWNGSLGGPTVANIDDDPDMEIVIGTVSSGAVAYDLPGSANARVLWGTSRGSLLRSGNADDPGTVIGEGGNGAGGGSATGGGSAHGGGTGTGANDGTGGSGANGNGADGAGSEDGCDCGAGASGEASARWPMILAALGFGMTRRRLRR